MKKRNPKLLIGVLGCMAQNLKDEILESKPYVDIVLGPDSYLVIDTLFVKPMTEAFKSSILKVTDKPLNSIICTHHHADHTLGLAWFSRDIPVIAHEHMRERMIHPGLDLGHFRQVNPEYAKYLKVVDKQNSNIVDHVPNKTIREKI